VAFQLTANNAPSARKAHIMRTPCNHCGAGSGYIEMRTGQACVFCASCGKWNYNAPRSELQLSTGQTEAHRLDRIEREWLTDPDSIERDDDCDY
jgi:hypothetical protein